MRFEPGHIRMSFRCILTVKDGARTNAGDVTTDGRGRVLFFG